MDQPAFKFSSLALVPVGVGGTRPTQRFVARRSRTVGLSRLFVGQRLLLHIAQVSRTCCMAIFAPPRTISHAAVVIHFLRGPRRRAGMAGLAIHCRTI